MREVLKNRTWLSSILLLQSIGAALAAKVRMCFHHRPAWVNRACSAGCNRKAVFWQTGAQSSGGCKKHQNSVCGFSGIPQNQEHNGTPVLNFIVFEG
ncbi:MAG: hypothetical protein ABJN42_15905, partial [Roseibium sp.]|uniref:hypothetical protein n=1 Tax=Roseibium sp. TaxID=1936156 RepID=UPI003298B0C9